MPAMLMSSRKELLCITRDFHHGISPFVAFYMAYGLTIVYVEGINVLYLFMRWFILMEFGYNSHRKVTGIYWKMKSEEEWIEISGNDLGIKWK